MREGRTSVDVFGATNAVMRYVGMVCVVGVLCVEGCGVGCDASMDSALPCWRVVAMSWYMWLRLSDLVSGSVGAILLRSVMASLPSLPYVDRTKGCRLGWWLYFRLLSCSLLCMGFFVVGCWSLLTVSVVSGEVTVTSM